MAQVFIGSMPPTTRVPDRCPHPFGGEHRAYPIGENDRGIDPSSCRHCIEGSEASDAYKAIHGHRPRDPRSVAFAFRLVREQGLYERMFRAIHGDID